MAVTQYSVQTIKEFTYRGGIQQFSNRYYFDGSEPSNWDALFDALKDEEKLFLASDVAFVKARGYAPGSDVSVANKTYSVGGTQTYTSRTAAPGDCALCLKQATTKLSTKSHTVYVFTYVHKAQIASGATDGDTPVSAQKTALATYGAHWRDGIVVGGRTYKRTTPDGHAVTSATVLDFITHRDFPR